MGSVTRRGGRFHHTPGFLSIDVFLALKRAQLSDLPNGHTIIIGGQQVKLPVEPVLRLIGLGTSIVIAVATGAVMTAEWPTLALFWYAPSTVGEVVDPIFGKPLNFYLFTLPAWELILGWLLTLAVIICVLAAVFVLIPGRKKNTADIGAIVAQLKAERAKLDKAIEALSGDAGDSGRGPRNRKLSAAARARIAAAQRARWAKFKAKTKR